MLEEVLFATTLLAAVAAATDIISEWTQSHCFRISLEVLVVFVKLWALRTGNLKFCWTSMCMVSQELGIGS